MCVAIMRRHECARISAAYCPQLTAEPFSLVSLHLNTKNALVQSAQETQLVMIYQLCGMAIQVLRKWMCCCM